MNQENRLLDLKGRIGATKRAYNFVDVIFKYVSWLFLIGGMQYFAQATGSRVLNFAYQLLLIAMYVPPMRFIQVPTASIRGDWKALAQILLELLLALLFAIITNYELIRLTSAIAAHH